MVQRIIVNFGFEISFVHFSWIKDNKIYQISYIKIAFKYEPDILNFIETKCEKLSH